MLIAAADPRHLRDARLATNDTVVAVVNDQARVIDSILHLLPQTTNVSMVIGNSPLEQFWVSESRPSRTLTQTDLAKARAWLAAAP
jgi:hypothetical protein